MATLGSVEEVVNTIIHAVKPNVQKVIASQNYVHPTGTFIIAEEVLAETSATPTRELTSKNGKWLRAMDYKYNINIGVQGRVLGDARGIAEDLHFLFLTSADIKHAFEELGYSLMVEKSINKVGMKLDTDQYVRYIFRIVLGTTRYIAEERFTIDKVNLTGEFLVTDDIEPDITYDESIP